MRRALIIAAVIAGTFTTVPAFAATVPVNFPSTCDAGHGAPGGLGKFSPYYFVRDDPGFGQEQGRVTGLGNSGFSASCNGT